MFLVLVAELRTLANFFADALGGATGSRLAHAAVAFVMLFELYVDLGPRRLDIACGIATLLRLCADTSVHTSSVRSPALVAWPMHPALV